jgi:hypothetical protein
VEREMEEEKKEAECDMVCTTSFIQANLQHNIAASRVLSRTVSVKVIHMALIQEPWYCEGRSRGLNIPGYTPFFAGGIARPRACIPTKNKTTWMLPGFSSRDLVAVLIKYNEDGAERQLVVCSAYRPYDSEDPPRQRNFRNSCDIVRVKISV